MLGDRPLRGHLEPHVEDGLLRVDVYGTDRRTPELIEYWPIGHSHQSYRCFDRDRGGALAQSTLMKLVHPTPDTVDFASGRSWALVELLKFVLLPTGTDQPKHAACMEDNPDPSIPDLKSVDAVPGPTPGPEQRPMRHALFGDDESRRSPAANGEPRR